jgi:hypothetical protein
MSDNMLMYYWDHILEISISNQRGDRDSFKERVTSSEELNPEQLRKIAGELIDDLYPNWCLVDCHLTEIKKKSFR